MELLKKGDRIALINIGNMPPQRFYNQILLIERYLNELGYDVVNYLDYNIVGDASIRVSNFHRCFTDDCVKAIFPISDGNFDLKVLELIDYDLIQKHPKIICGYSGLSTLLFMITYKANVPTFYGPHINFINSYSSKRENMFTVYSFWNLFQKQAVGKSRMSLLEKRNFFQYSSSFKNLKFHNIYSSSEKLKHKYINSFCEKSIICGTIYAVTLEGFSELVCYHNINIKEDFILMLDIFEQAFEEIEADLWKIIKNVNLNYCKCIYISTITYRDTGNVNRDAFMNKVYQFMRYIKDNILTCETELLYGFPLGHSRYKLTLPTGIKATISTNTGEIQMKDFL